MKRFERKISRKGTVRAGKGFTSSISNEYMNHFIKIEKSLEDSDVFIDGITETVKDDIKKQEGGFLGVFFRTWHFQPLHKYNQ